MRSGILPFMSRQYITLLNCQLNISDTNKSVRRFNLLLILFFQTKLNYFLDVTQSIVNRFAITSASLEQRATDNVEAIGILFNNNGKVFFLLA